MSITRQMQRVHMPVILTCSDYGVQISDVTPLANSTWRVAVISRSPSLQTTQTILILALALIVCEVWTLHRVKHAAELEQFSQSRLIPREQFITARCKDGSQNIFLGEVRLSLVFGDMSKIISSSSPSQSTSLSLIITLCNEIHTAKRYLAHGIHTGTGMQNFVRLDSKYHSNMYHLLSPQRESST